MSDRNWNRPAPVLAKVERMEEKRSGEIFIEVLRALWKQRRVVFWHKDDAYPREAKANEIMVGWRDDNGYYLLSPGAAYAAVYNFCQQMGIPFAFKKNAVWSDLKRLGYIEYQNGRTGNIACIYGQVRRVVKLKKQVLDEAQCVKT